MNLIKTGSAILNQTPLDWKNNTSNIISAIQEAKQKDVSILCLPELCISGYGCEDTFHAPFVINEVLNQLQTILPFTKDICVCLGLPLFIGSSLFNAAALIVNEKISGFVCKQFLAGAGVHYEQRWFKAWPKGMQKEIHIFDQITPAGDLIFNFKKLKIGIEICEDAWNVNRPARDFALMDVDIILNPSASHFAFGKLALRKQILLESSRFCNSTYIYSNLNGCESGRIIYDGGAMIANCGRLLNQGKRFTYKKMDLVTAVVNMDENKIQKTKNINYQCLNAHPLIKQIEVSFELFEAKLENQLVRTEEWEDSKHLKEEEFTRALGLGLYDTMRKSKSQGFIVSLSGGVDSGTVVLMIYYMVLQIEKELGNHELLKRFSTLFHEKETITKQEILKRILTSVYQSTKNSSDKTLNAAKSLSDAIQCTFYQFDIDPLVEHYVNLAEKSISRKLNWEQDDIALQNIQARVRAPSVWLLANLKNALLLATSNRSEAALGYATMDGDTCGGLAPLGGIDKKFLIEWMNWVLNEGPENLTPVPEVALILSQKPTAELRPDAKAQTDEEDLMPYWLLDRIEKLFIREKKSPEEIFKILSIENLKGRSTDDLKYDIIKFFTLWQRTQWKRERYAPGFHLDDESLDPKSSCRYPILSGDFSYELKKLQKVDITDESR